MRAGAKRVLSGLALALALAIPATAQDVSLFSLELHIDSGSRRLAAYQVEFRYDRSRLVLVGVEGGEAPFHRSPYYDSAGFKTDRIVLASFTSEPSPPAGRLLVGRILLLYREASGGRTEAKLVLAAGPNGERHEADLDVVRLVDGGDR